MQTEDSAMPRLLELQMSNITLNKTDYRVATFCDVTESQKAAQAESNVRMVEFMT